MAGNLVISQINGGPIGVINAIINGNFQVNQRGVSGTVTLAAGAYGHDRWKAGASGCTYTFATVANVTTLTITAGSLIQVIEGLNLYSGTYVLSWTGTAQGRINGGSYSGSGVTGTVTGGTNLNIEFNTGTLSLVQFEPGSVVSPFERRDYGRELMMCQRYYQAATLTGQVAGTYWLGAIDAFHMPQIAFPVVMRSNPTATAVGRGGGSAFWTNPATSTFSADSTAGWIASATDSHIQLRNTRQAGGSAPSNGLTYFYQSGVIYTASAEL